MTKEQFFDEMLKWVNFHKEKLEQTELWRGKDFIRNLSNLQALKSFMDSNPELLPHEINLLIMLNPKIKTLNQMLNSNIYLVKELKENIHSSMDIAQWI